MISFNVYNSLTEIFDPLMAQRERNTALFSLFFFVLCTKLGCEHIQAQVLAQIQTGPVLFLGLKFRFNVVLVVVLGYGLSSCS